MGGEAGYVKWLILIFVILILLAIINFNTIHFILAPMAIKLHAKLIEIKGLIMLYRDQLPDL